MIKQAKVVQVIEVQSTEGNRYFSLDGELLGGLTTEGIIKQEVEIKPEEPKGSVLRPPTPKEVKYKNEKELEKDLRVDSILKKHEG